MVEETYSLPQIQNVAKDNIKKRMRAVAGELLSEELVPESLKGEIWIDLSPDGWLVIERTYLEQDKFDKYLEWVRNSEKIEDSEMWDEVIRPGDYPIPDGILTKMVEVAEPWQKVSKDGVFVCAVRIYRRMRGEFRARGLSYYMGRALARTEFKHSNPMKTVKMLEERIPRETGRILKSLQT